MKTDNTRTVHSCWLREAPVSPAAYRDRHDQTRAADLLFADSLGQVPQAGIAVDGAMRRPVMAHWVCGKCDAGGSDIETPDGPVRCWLCTGEVLVTARIVQTGHPII